MELVAHDVQQVKFLVFESLSESSIQLRATILQLMEAFGRHVKNSIIVVASKRDKANDVEASMKLMNMRKIMSDIGIGENLIEWKNTGFTNDQEFDSQLLYLELLLDQTELTSIKELEYMNKQIMIRARELCDSQMPRLENVEIEVEEEYVESYTETVSVEVEHWEKIERPSRLIIEQNEAGGIALYALTFGIGFLADVAATKNRPPETEWVQTTRKETRDEERFRTKKRTVKKTKQIEVRKLVDEFTDQARAQVIREARDSLMACNLTTLHT
jgi:hypothetical protein